MRQAFSIARVAARVRPVACAVVIAVAASAATGDEPGSASPAAREMSGYWITPNFSSVVRIAPCGEGVCGTLVWLYEVAVDGKRLLDEKHPDEALRNRSLIGVPLFDELRPTDDGFRGRIYNPADGRRYRATARQPNANLLRLRGCWGPFCKSQRWRRLGTVRLPNANDLERVGR